MFFVIFLTLIGFLLSQVIYIDPTAQISSSPPTFNLIDQAFTATLSNSTYQNSTFSLKETTSAFVSQNQNFNISKSITIE